MADDASYTSFLQKANAPLPSTAKSTSTSQSKSKSKHDPPTPTTAYPPSLQSLATYTYTSDTDFPFEPIALPYNNNNNSSSSTLPSESEFAACIQAPPQDVELVTEEEFQEYAEVLRRVAEAGRGPQEGGEDGERNVRIFRVGMGATRAVYYVVAVGEGKLVGVRAMAVES